jgi:hypothetical protein
MNDMAEHARRALDIVDGVPQDKWVLTGLNQYIAKSHFGEIAFNTTGIKTGKFLTHAMNHYRDICRAFLDLCAESEKQTARIEELELKLYAPQANAIMQSVARLKEAAQDVDAREEARPDTTEAISETHSTHADDALAYAPQVIANMQEAARLTKEHSIQFPGEAKLLDADSPGYWREWNAKADTVCKWINDILDGMPFVGVCCEPWKSTHRRLLGLVAERDAFADTIAIQWHHNDRNGISTHIPKPILDERVRAARNQLTALEDSVERLTKERDAARAAAKRAYVYALVTKADWNHDLAEEAWNESDIKKALEGDDK